MMARLGERARMPFSIHPHMLRHSCGFKYANEGKDTARSRAPQHSIDGQVRGDSPPVLARVPSPIWHEGHPLGFSGLPCPDMQSIAPEGRERFGKEVARATKCTIPGTSRERRAPGEAFEAVAGETSMSGARTGPLTTLRATLGDCLRRTGFRRSRRKSVMSGPNFQAAE
jgi:hypothetical protein